MTWSVPQMWSGADVFIIGGGPSVPYQFDVPEEIIKKVWTRELTPAAYSPYMEALYNKHVIAVNMAYLIGNWVDMVFFGDKRWFYENRERLSKFPRLKVSCHPHMRSNKFKGENIKYLFRDKSKGRGISDNSRAVCWNANSGAAAISIAANTGAKRIILLGFDMRLQSNHQHWHGLYRPVGKPDPKPPFSRHLVGFPIIAQDAKRRKIEILNACPDSKIECFQKINVKDILCLN